MADATHHVDVPTIRTLEEWDVLKTAGVQDAGLLQCGSPVCTRCPAFTAAIEGLKSSFKFTHIYVNTYDAEEDLLEELQVSHLPAFVLLSGKDQAQGQACTPDQVGTAVRTLCAPQLVLDEEF